MVAIRGVIATSLLAVAGASVLAQGVGEESKTPKNASPKQNEWTQPDTTSSIGGSVRDSTGHFLSDVEVYVVTSGRSTRTDIVGHYVLTDVIQGPTRLRARRPGWKPADTTLVIASHSIVTMNFILSGRVAALDTIRVTSSQDDCAPRKFAGFQCRRKAGIGVFRDSAELAALKPEYIADMFDGIPGLRRAGRDVEATTRWRCLTYLFNGHPPMPVDQLTYRMNWFVHDVVAVEFYEDADTAPSWYKLWTWGGGGAPAPCSLIVYWTRGSR